VVFLGVSKLRWWSELEGNQWEVKRLYLAQIISNESQLGEVDKEWQTKVFLLHTSQLDDYLHMRDGVELLLKY
jgi:hypothetical protein